MDKIIPEDKLSLYTSAVRSLNNGKEYVVSLMPFNTDEIESLDDKQKWDRLKEMSVEYLKNQGEIPSFAKAQDYERSGSASYAAYSTIVRIKNEVSEPEKIEKKAIKVFNNAFDKIILPDGFREKIVETISQLKDSKKIFEDWGIGEKIKKGRGINLLFSGQSGTGKTYCGEIISEYLGTQCNVVTVSNIESKYVGESEKNVSTIFKSLNGNNQVLILDEVDSWLTSRGEIKQNHENKLTNQFLIELERHNGICVMTTNRPVKLDKALQRRIDLVLDFPFPTKAARKRIWKYMIPAKLPQEKINLDLIAEIILNGGQIKNVLLSSARYMATYDKNKLTNGILMEKALEEVEEAKTLTNGDFS